ncbi:hypothetical protein CR969_01545 [Candidatus Saccharibacteria bacterium]|nr:MAG: hypothetical protein CR969_01545 [Candidatus Saccharibacteria bacterium]
MSEIPNPSQKPKSPDVTVGDWGNLLDGDTEPIGLEDFGPVNEPSPEAVDVASVDKESHTYEELAERIVALKDAIGSNHEARQAQLGGGLSEFSKRTQDIIERLRAGVGINQQDHDEFVNHILPQVSRTLRDEADRAEGDKKSVDELSGIVESTIDSDDLQEIADTLSKLAGNISRASAARGLAYDDSTRIYGEINKLKFGQPVDIDAIAGSLAHFNHSIYHIVSMGAENNQEIDSLIDKMSSIVRGSSDDEVSLDG